VTGRDELPLPDYDHLPTGSLLHRIRSLDEPRLRVLQAYETEHGNRTPVLEVIEARLGQLAAGGRPSEGDPTAPAPELAPAPSGGGPVSPATAGPPMNPPSQGVPTNPAQPRPTG
jgi:hypothetical protein